MGLDTSHDCWHGAYSSFHRWRCEIAHALGLPPLELMQGFWSREQRYIVSLELTEDFMRRLPISWDSVKVSEAMWQLLSHSDCDGEIGKDICRPMADELQELLPKLPPGSGGGHIGDWRDKTTQFIKGLHAASEAGENVEFH